MLKFLNVGVQHGIWGECIARRYLKRKGFVVLEVNSRPVKKDNRLELDIVAVDKVRDCLVFLEVKQHKSLSRYASERLRSIDKRKMRNVKKAANSWRIKAAHTGSYRFDVLQIYGTPELGVMQIVHTVDVCLFGDTSNHVDWN